MQRRIREVQTEQQMCIHKENLTELDIYHRILRYALRRVQYDPENKKLIPFVLDFRFKNYMVAMMNKNLIHSTVCLPIVGETNFFSKSLRFNLELIFFRKCFVSI